jgi:hypothetical protein
MKMTEQELKEFRSVREEAGLKIDPATAEVDWEFAEVADPYGIRPDLPKEYQQVGRVYFARSSKDEIWVWFGDLPEATRDALWEKHKDEIAFPAGLESPPATAILLTRTAGKLLEEFLKHKDEIAFPAGSEILLAAAIQSTRAAGKLLEEFYEIAFPAGLEPPASPRLRR